ncbi:MAG TPA: glycosyl hydrolase 115 family protein [Gemmatimonadaceae bacterium]|nr:glycosyl hydrolase 115 family protein [Gemmatimonadaceae bacterium]
MRLTHAFAASLLVLGSVSFPERLVAQDRFALAAGGRAVPLLVSEADWPGVARAVGDLAADVERVSGTRPSVGARAPAGSDRAVIVGTIGRSPLVDALIAEGKLDVRDVRGRWESYRRQVVARPLPGVRSALVIAGSDKRGTIYGVYDVSSAIGVSPWYWWADVPVRRQAEPAVAAAPMTQGEPAVKYRGIFINDEAPAFSGWTRETFGGVNHLAYEHVFELILRLKGNYLWPAMWGNAFADDDSLNPVLADRYGIVMGTSHHEPMTRAQQEWRRYGHGPWNYEQNDSTLRDFWRKGIERMGTRENIVTLGMRGDGDMPMTEGSNIALLERIVADQRRILAEVTGKGPSRTPTLWALYKEVQDYYDKGMRVPDDVTLLFSDDNWGNIRRLPAKAERNRAGGFGVYYHFDYVGGPRNYKWINTNPIARVWEQMHLAHAWGANRIWIVNVGDLKPMEYPIQFFLDYAFDPERWPAERLPEYARTWSRQQFGPEHADEIADLVTRTLVYAGRRKPELLAPETYSLTDYGEADRVRAGYDSLARRAAAVKASLPADARAAFYELVEHPILAAGTLDALYVLAARNRLYAQQGRAATNLVADSVRLLFDRDAEISRYYNHELAGGKWAHMMDQTHIGYTYWQEPPRNVMPRVDVIQVPAGPELGVAWDGQQPFVPGQRPPPGAFRSREPTLPELDAYSRRTSWIEAYDRGAAPVAFRVTSGAPYVLVAPTQGTTATQQRITVDVDWAHAPAGTTTVPITVSADSSRSFVVRAIVRNPASPRREEVQGFAESQGYVSMEAEHFSRAVAPAPIRWTRIPDLGRTSSGMTAEPVTIDARTPGGDGPRLEYQMVLFDTGAVTVRAYLSPTQNFSGASHGLRYAVSLDDETPQIVNVTADSSLRAWEQSVADEITIQETRHRVATPGQHVLKFWLVDPGVVLQKLVVDAGGIRPSYLGPPESWHAPPGRTPHRGS